MMIIIAVILALATGLLIVRLCDQHKHITIFEQIVLGFLVALSLFVAEFFLEGLIFDAFSWIGPVSSFLISLGLLIYKNMKNPGFVKEIGTHINADINRLNQQYNELLLWKKYALLCVGIYVVGKLCMVFALNTYMPTYDEDAVTGRDLKTKIFAEHKSLVLDTTSPEFFGADYGRYPFSALIDTYFLMPYGEFVTGLSNIISPIVYALSILLLFGILCRKANLFTATVAIYIFCSLPLVFIHGFGAYWNFSAGVFTFVFIFYLIDQCLNIEQRKMENNMIFFPLLMMGFLASCVRSESAIITGAAFVTVLATIFFLKQTNVLASSIKYKLLGLFMSIAGTYVVNKIIFASYPLGSKLNNGFQNYQGNIVTTFFDHITQPGVFTAPFKQWLFHPDYNLLFVLFIITTILFVYRYKKSNIINSIFVVIIVLMGIYVVTLYTNFELGLITHFAALRYPIAIILFIIYFVCYELYTTKVLKN